MVLRVLRRELGLALRIKDFISKFEFERLAKSKIHPGDLIRCHIYSLYHCTGKRNGRCPAARSDSYDKGASYAVSRVMSNVKRDGTYIVELTGGEKRHPDWIIRRKPNAKNRRPPEAGTTT
jgi:hypothetical protein